MERKAVIRVRNAYAQSSLDWGHVGIALVDTEGGVTTYDTGHALHKKYRQSQSFLARTANLTSISSFYLTYVAMGVTLGHSLAQDGGFGASLVSTFVGAACGIKGLALAPVKRVLLVNAPQDSEFDKIYELPITREQYDNLKLEIEGKTSGIYNVPFNNCVDFAKTRLRRAAVLDLPRRAINTTGSFSCDLESALA